MAACFGRLGRDPTFARNGAIGGGIIQNNPFGAGWQVAGAADFNGDGKADLVYRRVSDGATEVQLLNGTTITGGGVPPAAAEPASASLFDPQSGVNGGGGNETIWGGAGQTITDNGTQGYDTVVGFSQSAGDRLSFPNDSAAAIDDVLASARTSNGNTILNLPDGSSFTLIDITHVDSSFFV